MANKAKLEMSGFDTILKRLNELGGDARQVTDEALRKTHEIVTHNAEIAMQKANLPAGGKYSTGDTLKSLIRKANVEWDGDVASVNVGFDIDNGGLVSIFLMHGTPRTKPDKKLYDAFYGRKEKREIVEAQEQVFYDAIRRLEG